MVHLASVDLVRQGRQLFGSVEPIQQESTKESKPMAKLAIIRPCFAITTVTEALRVSVATVMSSTSAS